MNTIQNLTAEDIHKKLPIKDLLLDSFYYPSCGFDGGIVKHYGKEIQSFIYCDYAVGVDALLSHLDDFRGYRCLGHRSVDKNELIPHGWDMQFPPNFDLNRYYQYKNEFATPFAYWAVYERMERFDENHGPKKFSLLYIGGEGVATYQALYWSNEISAKALAIIRPGTGFGLNWTDYTDRNGALAWVVMNNKFGKPDTVLYDGSDFEWDGYEKESAIRYYFSPPDHAIVTIWKLIKL